MSSQLVAFMALSPRRSLGQMRPMIISSMPLMTPSTWLESPILGFARMGTSKPDKRPARSSKTPRLMRRLEIRCFILAVSMIPPEKMVICPYYFFSLSPIRFQADQTDFKKVIHRAR
jgi:hypothetical protein